MEKQKILIIEDEPIISLGLKELLEENGYAVEMAKNNKEAINIVKKTPNFSMTIVDVKIAGDKNGIETVQEIQNIQNIPVIYLTAYAQDHLVKEVKEAYPSLFLTKPYNPQELLYNVQLAIAAKEDKLNWLQKSDFKDFSKNIGATLKQKRKALGLTQAAAAEKAGINYRHYQDIEGGKINIRLDTFFNLLRFYNIDFEQIMRQKS